MEALLSKICSNGADGERVRFGGTGKWIVSEISIRLH